MKIIWAVFLLGMVTAGCDQSKSQKSDSQTTASTENEQLASSDNSDSQATPDSEAAPTTPAKSPFEHSDAYKDYYVLANDGTKISGKDFEDKIMCKPAFSNVENAMWVLKNLVLLPPEKDIVNYAGELAGKPVKVMTVIDETKHAPLFLYVGDVSFGQCNPFVSNP